MSETYIPIANTEIDLDSPLTTSLFFKIRDNPIAIAEGHVDAPRIQDAALDTGTATTEGVTWVHKRMAGISAGDIGSYAVLYVQSNIIGKAFGDTLSGSLLFSSYDLPLDTYGGAQIGTWRLMEGMPSVIAAGNKYLFLRIS